jgi:hypothetical protein
VMTFRTEKRRNPQTGARYPWIVPASKRGRGSSSRRSTTGSCPARTRPRCGRSATGRRCCASTTSSGSG